MAVEQNRKGAAKALGVEGVAVHALHKSASMFLYKFFRHVSQQRGYSFYSANNSPPNELPCPADSDRDGEQTLGKFCCCPLRTFEVGNEGAYDAELVRIYHVRDPRDMLVSEYFSFGWSHPTEGSGLEERKKKIQEMSVDDYVIEQPNFSSWPLEAKFQPLLNRELHPTREILVKYETMVTDFPTWARAVIRPFGYGIPKFALAKLAWKYRKEFQPTGEGSHRRAITPGDHRRKLKPATIAILNDRFAEVLEKFGYRA